MKRIICISICCLGTLAALLGQEKQPGQLLSEAIYQEEVNGELDKAIQTYQFIISEYPDNRNVAAEALLHLGLCYEKKGMQEATPAYRQLIEDYPDQKKAVTIAKERLSRFEQLDEKVSSTAPGPYFRKITIPTKPDNGVLSPDGEKMAFTSEGCVWIVPMQGNVQPDLAGEPYRITDPMEAMNFGNTMAWSGDGNWIAFNALDQGNDAMYVVPSSGVEEPKKIPVNMLRSGGGDMHDHRLSLSHDGQLLAYSSSALNADPDALLWEEPFSIYIFSLKDGSISQLTEKHTTQPAFSPDDRMIAYVKSYRNEGGASVYEGWVIPSGGGNPVRIAEPANYYSGPVWSPDGKMIAFNTRPDMQANICQVLIVSISEDGKQPDSKQLIELPQYTFGIPDGWSRNNTIGFHLVNPRFQAIYTVPLSGGKATQVTPYGWGNNPCWSTDGRRIFYRWADSLRYVPAKGGDFSSIPIQSEEKIYEVLPGGGNHISPDGKSLLFSGYVTGTEGWLVHLMIMPVEGGKPEVITQSPTQDRFPCWSPDGKNIAFVRYSGNPERNVTTNIYTVSGAGGAVKQITTDQDSVSWSSIKYTPDGDHMVYYCQDKSIKLIPVDGGKSREVVKVPALDPHNEIIMLKDGEHMAYTSNGKMWMVPLNGGEPVQIETGLSDWFHSQIAQSPDGKTIAFTAFTGGDSELWLMENFLTDSK